MVPLSWEKGTAKSGRAFAIVACACGKNECCGSCGRTVCSLPAGWRWSWSTRMVGRCACASGSTAPASPGNRSSGRAGWNTPRRASPRWGTPSARSIRSPRPTPRAAGQPRAPTGRCSSPVLAARGRWQVTACRPRRSVTATPRDSATTRSRDRSHLRSRRAAYARCPRRRAQLGQQLLSRHRRRHALAAPAPHRLPRAPACQPRLVSPPP